MKRHLILLLILKNNSMNRRDFSKITALGMTVAPFISAAHANDPLFDTPGENPKVPLGMDAHAISLMKWKAKQLIDYAIDLNMDSILFNALSYFDNLEEDYLKSIHDLLESNNAGFHTRYTLQQRPLEIPLTQTCDLNHLTTVTGQCACRITSSATVPKSILLIPLVPFVPRNIAEKSPTTAILAISDETGPCAILRLHSMSLLTFSTISFARARIASPFSFLI